MPRTAEDVESFLYRLDRTFDSEGGTYLVSTGVDRPPVALRVMDPIVVARLDIGKAPEDEKKQLAVFRKLLEYNATDLAHASYGLEDGEIVLSAGLELENLDMNELAAILSDIDLALARHIKELRELVGD
jgi:hypothetical protein